MVRSALTAAFLGTGACGLRVPDLQNYGGDVNESTGKNHEEADENIIVNHIKCEIHLGLQNTIYDPRFYSVDPQSGRPVWVGKPVDWLLRWGAKVSYVLTADERSGLNPGLTYTNPFLRTGTSASIGGGIQASTEAQRRETGAVTYAFADLLKERWLKGCSDQNGVLIHSNLRIGEFISNKVFLARVPGTLATNAASIDDPKPLIFNAFSDELTFTVVYGGSLTPSWNFVRLSVNPTAPFLNATRTKIQYVTITLGPVLSPSSPAVAAQLTQEAQLLDSANLIGHAVSAARLNSP